jgi:hypothetical protein
VWVVASACGSRRPADHALAMARLAAAGCTLVSTEMVIFEWLHNCQHKDFRAVLTRLKAGRVAMRQARACSGWKCG